ncbi:MAG: hypothetical protein QOE63_1156 [Acidimicrobiaceae bacterium]|jgi:hypothetical protein
MGIENARQRADVVRMAWRLPGALLSTGAGWLSTAIGGEVPLVAHNADDVRSPVKEATWPW